MALDYRKCAEQIAANIGGGANVISAAHCATRLRLVIADNGSPLLKAKSRMVCPAVDRDGLAMAFQKLDLI